MNAVHLTLAAVAEALGDEDYRPGHAVRVPLEQTVMPLTRDACLATVAPRGVASSCSQLHHLRGTSPRMTMKEGLSPCS